MSYQSAIRNAVVMLATGTCAAFFAGTTPAHAQQLQVLGASPPQDSTPEVSISRRLILHNVGVSGPSLAVAPNSRPLLDYAVKLLRKHPATVVNVSGQGNRSAQRRQTQAVAQYLEQCGISSNRVVLQNTALASTAPSGGSANTGVVLVNLTTPS